MVGGGEGDDQLWGSGRSAIAGCHCGVLWGSGRSAIAGCHCRVPISVSYPPSIFRATDFTQTSKKTTMNFVLSFLQMLHCFLMFSTLITQKLFFAIWGLCWCNFLDGQRKWVVSIFPTVLAIYESTPTSEILTIHDLSKKDHLLKVYTFLLSLSIFQRAKSVKRWP